MDPHETPSNVVDQAPPKPSIPAGPAPATHHRSPIATIIGGVAAAALIVGVGWFVLSRRAEATAANRDQSGKGGAKGGDPGDGKMRVEVARPRPGGIERKIVVTCSVHAFEYAQLYAKVSGFLQEQTVDIGDKVKRNQPLALIEVPEVHKAVDQAKAAVDQTLATVKVADAKIRSAQAMREAAAAGVSRVTAEVQTQVARREYRSKQYERIQGLVQRNAVEAKLLDESRDELDSAIAAERVAQQAVLESRATLLSKDAMIEQARADLIEANANVEAARADLGKAEVLAAYTKITSPYDGVVTLRSFHRGDFVRSASEGGAVPLLAVARVDLMRVVVPMPDREVPFTDKGDRAIVAIDALPGETFEGKIARFSESEDAQDRNMRTEIDLDNAAGKLREGMYGQATVILHAPAPGSVTVPSTSLLNQSGSGAGEVFVVRDGKARKVSVRVGMDNGSEVEVTSGLTADAEVITKYNGALQDGTAVTSESAKPAQPAR